MAAYDVFLSYARVDAARAGLIRDKLEALGLSVFFDAEAVDSGEEFPVVIDNAVKSAKCVLALWSKAALERRWVRIEGRIGLDQKKLVAATIDGTRPEELPAEFYNVNFESLADFRGDDAHPAWRRLLRAIGRRVGRADLAPEQSAPPPPTARPAHAAKLPPWAIGAFALVALALAFIAWPRSHEPAKPLAPAPQVVESSYKPAAPDLSGEWIGEYWGQNAARTTFAVNMQSDGAHFRGALRENNTFAAGAGPTLGANIDGEAQEDGALAFRKTYDGSGGVSHSVDYQGRYDASSGAITGSWRVQSNAGEFRMVRR